MQNTLPNPKRVPADRAHTGGLDFPVGDVDFVGDVLLGESHVGGEGGVRLPLGRGPWRGLLHHLVDLLEGESLGLGDEEVGVEEGAGAEGSPDEEHLGLEIALVLVNHVWSDDGDDLSRLLVKPITYATHTSLLLTQFQSQLDAVDRATPRERMGRGKISPMTTQAPGPQALAKKKM